MVTLGADALEPYPRFSRYNSPYIAHREGRAIDLYPGRETAPSPVAGTVIDTERRRCPDRPYAAEHDFLLVVDTGERLARLLHVDPEVATGEAIKVGDPLGRLIRSGYFAPWVANHVHLGFREYGTNPRRASGSLRLHTGVDVGGVPWDGTGTVVETGDTYAILDGPTHPDPGERYVGITDDSGAVVLDGGLPHYENGGVSPIHRAPRGDPPDSIGDGRGAPNAIRFLGTDLGAPAGEELPWEDSQVFANDREITGLSFFLGRDTIFAKLITRKKAFEDGEFVEVRIE